MGVWWRGITGVFVVVCWSSPGYKPFIAALLEQGPRHPPTQIVLQDGPALSAVAAEWSRCPHSSETAVDTGDKNDKTTLTQVSASRTRPKYFIWNIPFALLNASGLWRSPEKGWCGPCATFHPFAARGFYIFMVAPSQIDQISDVQRCR